MILEVIGYLVLLYVGVTRAGSKYQAQINKDRKYYYLGLFNTPEEAHEVYKAKAVGLYGEYFSDGFRKEHKGEINE